jgi:hypothetical protein
VKAAVSTNSASDDAVADFLFAKQVPAYAKERGVHTTEGALAMMRCRGTGPRWSRLPVQNICVYRIEDVDAWIETQKRPRPWRYKTKTAKKTAAPATATATSPSNNQEITAAPETSAS